MPVQNSLSWADKIKNAAESRAKFEPVPVGRYDFKIIKAEVAQGQKGDYIKYRASILSGPRANALVFESTYPNADNIGFFLEFWHGLGFNDDWLMSAQAPTTDQIASSLVGREFSGEVYIRDDAKADKNGDQYRSLRKFHPYGGAAQAAPAAVASAPAQNFGSPTAVTAGGSPWGAPVPDAAPTAPAAVAPASIPTPDQANPWNATQAAPAPAASGGAPPNPFA